MSERLTVSDVSKCVNVSKGLITHNNAKTKLKHILL